MRLSFFLLLSAQWGLSMPFIDDTGEDKWSFSLAALNWIEWHWTFILVSMPDCSSPSSTAPTSILPIWKVRHRLLKLWCKIRVCVCVLSRVWLFATQQTVVHEAPLSMGFFIKNTGVGCHFLLQRIFLTQRLNLCRTCLLHWQEYSWSLCHSGSSKIKVNWFKIRTSGSVKVGTL